MDEGQMGQNVSDQDRRISYKDGAVITEYQRKTVVNQLAKSTSSTFDKDRASITSSIFHFPHFQGYPSLSFVKND